jgi:hypothetical protein
VAPRADGYLTQEETRVPWQHCDTAAIRDDEPCPACGITKEQWTVEFQVTRTFKVKRRPQARLLLVDVDGDPVPGIAFRVERPDGQPPIEGATDELGAARIASDGGGVCALTFPGLPPDAVVDAESGAAGDGGRFDVDVGAQRRLRLLMNRLLLRFRAFGRARGDVPWRLRFDGGERSGTLDAEGRVDVIIPREVETAELLLGAGGRERYKLRIAALSPLDDVRGAQERLRNLDLYSGRVDGALGPLTRAALTTFQSMSGLEATGELDAATRDRLASLGQR